MKKNIIVIIGLIPFIFSFYYILDNFHGIISSIGALILGMGGSLMTIGLLLEKFANDDHGSSGTLAFFSFPILILGGILMYVGNILK